MFWFLAKKQSIGVHKTILKRGNCIEEMTPCIGILPNGTNVFVKIQSSKHKTETLFSSRTIDINRMYCLAVTFEIDYNNELTDISLYLDGLVDSKITIPGEPLHNQGNLYIGKVDNLSYGFVGCVADVILIPRVLLPEEVNLIYKGCIYNLNNYKHFRTYEVVGRKLEKDILLEKYSKHAGIPLHLLNNLDLTNDELREVVNKYENHEYIETKDGEKEQERQDIEKLQTLQQFLGSEDSDRCINVKKIATNSRFIFTILYLSADDVKYEVNRFINILDVLKETLHILITDKDLIELAKVLQCYFKVDNKIQIDTFFKDLKFYMCNLFPDMKMYPFENESVVEFNSVELHENLLLNSQNFKNYIDDEFEKDLGKNSFSIRSLYTRNKSGRPMTGRVQSATEFDDLVNHQYNFDDIPEKKNEIEEVDEENEDEKKIEEKQSHNIEEERNDEKKSEKKTIEEKLEGGEIIEVPQEVCKQSTEPNKDSNDVQESIEAKQEEILPADKLIESKADDFKPEIIEATASNVKKASKKSVLQEITEHKDEPKYDSNIASHQDIINNLDNKVMLNSHDNTNHFSDPDNIIPVSQINELDKKPTENVVKTENDMEPKFPDNWAEGAFEIVINHCYNCHKHKTSTRHYEFTFVNKFNAIGEAIKAVFPNAVILGNYDKVEYFSCFDVYIRGVSLKTDEQGRYFLYRKLNSKKFPKDSDITDKLIALSMLYGSSINMQAAQAQWYKAYSSTIPKKNTEAHDFPHDLPDEAEKERIALENARIAPVFIINIAQR
jgi:hypothetical protein